MSRHKPQKPAEWNEWASHRCTHCQQNCTSRNPCGCCDHYYGSELPSGGDREHR